MGKSSLRSWRQLALEQLDEQDGEAEQSNGKMNGSPFNKGEGAPTCRVRAFAVCVLGVGWGALLSVYRVPPTTSAAAVCALQICVPSLFLNMGIHVCLQTSSESPRQSSTVVPTNLGCLMRTLWQRDLSSPCS